MFVPQEAVRVHLHGGVSLPVLPDPLLPLPPERHPGARVRAVRHGVLHPGYRRHGGHRESDGWRGKLCPVSDVL